MSKRTHFSLNVASSAARFPATVSLYVTWCHKFVLNGCSKLTGNPHCPEYTKVMRRVVDTLQGAAQSTNVAFPCQSLSKTPVKSCKEWNTDSEFGSHYHRLLKLAFACANGGITM